MLGNKIAKGNNRLKIVLRNSANAIGNFKVPLKDFFHRINFRKGRVSAISATARKLAVIIWNMVIKKVAYLNPETYLFHEQKRKVKAIANIKKQISKFDLTNEQLGFAIA